MPAMETIRVDIAYRPLRICWAIKAGDKDAFRTAVRQSCALWGGRFNPIVVIEREAEASEIIEAFRADWVLPVNAGDEGRTFAAKFIGRSKPTFVDDVFSGDEEYGGRASVLDVQNALVHFRGRSEWKDLKDEGFRRYTWSAGDALADVFLAQLGAYPDPRTVHIDYAKMFDELGTSVVDIASDSVLPSDLFDHPTVSSLSRCGLERHYSVYPGRGGSGYFVGDAGNLDDLVTFWNLRAADISLCFFDHAHVDRFKPATVSWTKRIQESLALRRDGMYDRLTLWSRGGTGTYTDEQVREAGDAIGGDVFFSRAGKHTWNGMNVVPPTMRFAEVSTLGVLVREKGKPKLSFSLADKPFSSDAWFHTQNFAASLSFSGGLYSDPDYTLRPPFLPELNDFYRQEMHWGIRDVRIESERIALIASTTDADAFVHALTVVRLFEKLFEDIGYEAKLSSAGLIARQLIAQLGGLLEGGAYAFRIPGVRRLLRKHGPASSFSRRSAHQLIASADPENPSASSFKDFADLHFGLRKPGQVALQPGDVFSHLVEKGLFRIGADLLCPNCQMTHWVAVDVLRQHIVCEMCGGGFDATRQLADGGWAFRRSGVIGVERNAQGAVPVALALQQLHVNLIHSMSSNCYSTSLDLIPKRGVAQPQCEIDFIWMIGNRYPDRTTIIIGECKDRGRPRGEGSSGGSIERSDVENLRRVADLFPRRRFNVYILFAKLCEFTADEIALVRTLNAERQPRVILLSDKELEATRFFEGQDSAARHTRDNVEGFAKATDAVYFQSGS